MVKRASDPVDEILDSFLGEGPVEVDGLVIEEALAWISTTPQRGAMGRRWSLFRALAVAAALVLLVTGGLVVGQLTTPHPVPSPSASVLPSAEAWPSGGLVPDSLARSWARTNRDPGGLSISLSLGGNAYSFANGSEHHGGKVVVDGDRLLLFDGDGCVALPGGIGEYRWTLSGDGVLSLQLIQDPCPRADSLGDSTWDRMR